MPGVKLGPGQALLVAARGEGPEHGLMRWVERDGTWRGALLATVNQLSSLARHPSLPVVYGTSRIGGDGEIHAWRVTGDTAEVLGGKPSLGSDPCHLVVDPGGRLLIFTNYSTSTIGVQNLDADGGFDGALELLRLTGSGPETERQEDAHPHQAFFAGETLFVIDLGADLVREFALRPGARGTAALVAGRTTAVPAGSGPRHAVMLPDGRLAISAELGSSLLVGRPGDPVEAWANVRSTRKTGPAKTRHLRNYPGDIQRSEDGCFVYFANRGYDTISTFDVSGASPVLASEHDSGVAWPQHLLVLGDHVLIAGWDSSEVTALPLTEGKPGQAAAVFACPGAGWLLLSR
jgi:6-phosphogluconolactonase (cycloisomerase 2 family)